MPWLEKLGVLCRRRASLCVLLVGAAVGLACFLSYYSRGLTTVHYDAKAHLVVARRIVDSQAPGYTQIGAQWLPLIHLVYLPFVLAESQYRSGMIPSLISVLSFAISVWLVFRISHRVTASLPAAAFAAMILVANPNLEFVQSSPLTEPMYMMFNLLCLESLMEWRRQEARKLPWRPASWAALAALCRYEGWLFLVGVLLLLVYDLATRRLAPRLAIKAAALISGCMIVPAVLHFGYIYARLGDSFLHRLARGYAAPEVTLRRPLLSLIYHFGEISQVATVALLLIGAAGTVMCLRQWKQLPERAPLLLLWLPALVNISALYWGLIYRVRYSVLLVPAIAIFGSLLLVSARTARGALVGGALTVMALPWLSWSFPHEWQYHFLYPGPGIILLPLAAAVLLLWGLARAAGALPLLFLCVLTMQLPVLEGETDAALREAMEHQYLEPERREVIEYLRTHYDGTAVLIDMSRQAPLVYDSGLQVRDFIYNEGDARAWHRAAQAPHLVVGWLCSEKGDEIWIRLRIDPQWAQRYSLAVQTANFVLYRLNPEDRLALRPAKQSE
jgi:hypothetical protein